jgi:hypothetical protein
MRDYLPRCGLDGETHGEPNPRASINLEIICMELWFQQDYCEIGRESDLKERLPRAIHAKHGWQGFLVCTLGALLHPMFQGFTLTLSDI